MVARPLEIVDDRRSRLARLRARSISSARALAADARKAS
jgi:hypothetical protein